MSRGNRTRKQLRGGFGLTDALGMMVVISMLLSLSAIVLNQAFVAQRSAMEHFRQSQSLQMLHDRLRADALAARRCEAGEEVRLEMKDGREISYSLLDDRVIRTTTVGEVTEGEELWRLPAKGMLQSRIDRSGVVALLYLELRFEQTDRALLPIQWIYRLQHGLENANPAASSPDVSPESEDQR